MIRFLGIASASLALSLGAVAPAQAADSDVSFNAAIEQYSHSSMASGTWDNALMPWATGRYSASSADEVLTATLRIYTRAVLDRGYWVNTWVDVPGYDSGNPLLAVAPGSGVTQSGSPWPAVADSPLHLALAALAPMGALADFRR
jgi:hypothetical protein